MKKGVQGYTVRDFFSSKEQSEETFRKIADIGYDSVQAGPPRGMTAETLQETLEALGLVNCSGYADYAKLKTGEAVAEAVRVARIYKTPYIGIGTIPDEYRYTREGFTQYAHTLNDIAAQLQEHGCSLLYHHHALEFLSLGGGVSGMDILVGETNPENVFWTLDTHWLASGGVNPVTWIKKLEGRVPIIHFKDYGIAGEVEQIEGVGKVFAEVGEGNLDWPPIVAACAETGVTFVVVEQDRCKGNPFDSLRISFENLCKFGV